MHSAQVPKVGWLFTHFVEGRLLLLLQHASTRQPQGLKFVIDGGSALSGTKKHSLFFLHRLLYKYKVTDANSKNHLLTWVWAVPADRGSLLHVAT